jgi:class 3 adenylate cyclase
VRTSAELAPGSSLAGFRIDCLLARGGMGVVYQATQLSLSRQVALKVVAPELAGEEQFRTRFLREVRVAASLDHPHVLPVYEAGEADGVLYLAMRLVEGESLAQLLAREGGLEPARAVSIVTQVGEALAAAHAAGLVHRDLKPGNVLLAHAGAREHAYLCDFGLARRAQSATELTKAGGFVGSVLYAAPEQIRGDAVDPSTDLYALGCLLYECLTAEPPFPREHEAAVLWAHLHESAPLPSAIRPSLGESFDGIVERALAKDPGERFASADEFTHSLAGELEEHRRPSPATQKESLPLDEVAAPARERKVVSVVVCDLFAASESADPEEAQARLSPYHAVIRERIESFGGRVEKFIGDAVIAVFGAPVVHEDDAERAVRAGLGVLEAVEELKANDPALEVSVRVGVNTGDAVVALDSHGAQGEAIIAGDVVGSAVRIQSTAPIDGVAVGARTHRATSLIFDYEPLAPIGATGKADAVQFWQALAPRARFGSGVVRSWTTPLVGRELDFALLRGTFDKVASERIVQLVTVIGEPGVGKSRLVAELFTYIDQLEGLVTWRQGRCLPYGDGITFWALGEIVKAHAGVYESDAPEVAREKLEAVLPDVEERPWLRARLLPLLGVESGDAVGQDEAFTAWRRFLESIAERDPAIFVFEDVHWADDALLTFLEHLADWMQGVPVLVVCTARPELYETHQAWGAGLTNHTSIRLGPLSDTDTARLVSALLEQAVLPAETQQLLLERAGGNPLYAEEFVRMLRDRDLVDAHGKLREGVDVPFPDSIQALIAARIDTLPADRKRLLQDAAVMGKVFWAGSLVAMGTCDQHTVELALHELVRKELVRPSRQSSMEGEVEFGFWHLLVRDVVYGQIPRAERATRHVAAASWLEAKSRERVEDLAEVLAYHTGEAIELVRAAGDQALAAEMAPTAARYALLAGERALGLDTTKALTLLERARGLVEERDPAFPAILIRWAEAASQMGRVSDATNALDHAVALLRKRDETESLAEALSILGIARRDVGVPGWLEPLREAAGLLEPLPPSRSLVTVLGRLSIGLMLANNFREACGVAERTLTLAADLGLDASDALVALAGSHASLGDARGLAEGRRAIELSTAAGDGGRAALNYNNLAVDTLGFQGPVAALAVFDEGMAFAAPRGLGRAVRSLNATRVNSLVLSGRFDDALELADRLLPELMEARDLIDHSEMLAYKTIVLAEQGHRSTDNADRALAEALESEATDTLATVFAAAARVRMGDHGSQIISLLRQLIEIEGQVMAPAYSFLLPLLVRCALAARSVDLANALIADVHPNQPIRGHALASSGALIAEARGEHEDAARQYANAAQRWESFTAVWEQAHAHLGQGRCLVAIGEPKADRPLREARRLFDGMGARPYIDECDALIAHASKRSS